MINDTRKKCRFSNVLFKKVAGVLFDQILFNQNLKNIKEPAADMSSATKPTKLLSNI